MIEHEAIAEAWDRALAYASESLDYSPDAMDESVRRLRGLVNHARGKACPGCAGEGSRTYASTATWRGGIGGQAMTVGVCDQCWGTGRTDRHGPNLRKLQHARPVDPWEAFALHVMSHGWAVQPLDPSSVVWRDGVRREAWACRAWLGEVSALLGWRGDGRVACRVTTRPTAAGFEDHGHGIHVLQHAIERHAEDAERKGHHAAAQRCRHALQSFATGDEAVPGGTER